MKRYGQAMEREILEQSFRLQENASRYYEEALQALESKASSFDMVLLAARGSSDNAALFARYLFEVHLGIPVSLAAPSVVTRFNRSVRYSNCLAIGISQSGAAPDVAEVLSDLKSNGHTTIAITNTEGSLLTQIADASILLGVGKEESVAATKTYTSSQVALYQLVRALCESVGGNVTPLPDPELPTAEWIETARAAAEEVSGTVVRSNPVFSLARGYGFSTALETALKLMECALIPCKAYSSADFEHGPKALAGHGSAAISYVGAMDGLAAQGCEILQAPVAPLSAEQQPIGPVWDVIFGQWIALETARARGLNPDKARHLSKVTETL